MTPSLRRYTDLLVKYLSPLWFKVLLLTLLIFTGIGLQLYNPQILGRFIDLVTDSDEIRPLVLNALLFWGLSILLQAINIATAYLSEDVGWRTTNQLRLDLTRHCFHLHMSFHNAHTPGEMIERIDGDIANIASFFSQFVIRVLGNSLLLIGVLIVLATLDWRISLALILYAFTALIGLNFLRQIAVPYWKDAYQANANLFGFLEEKLASIDDIRSNGAIPYAMHHLFAFSYGRTNKQLKANTVNTVFSIVWILFYTLGQVTAFISGYTLFQAGSITLGSVYLIIYYTHFIFQPLGALNSQLQGLQTVIASLDRIESLFQLKNELQETDGQAILPHAPLGIEFEGVTFGYSKDTPVLEDVSFYLQPGKVLGLLGRTGSGKTTLSRLLFRFYECDQGRIRIGTVNNGAAGSDFVNISQIALSDLRRRIGLVTQNVQLFHATIRDNLTFFDDSIPDETILQIIEDLGLADWYHSLPDGFDTILDTRGSNISAGEAQLLALARVFLHDPHVIIFDEASSYLDPLTEHYIEQAVDRLLEGRTGIIIAHRLQTVHRVDEIMIMEGGQILEFGAYATLVRDPLSHFYRLLQTGLKEITE